MNSRMPTPGPITRAPYRVCFAVPRLYPLLNPAAEGMIGGAERQAFYLAQALADDPAFDVHCCVADFGQPRYERIGQLHVWRGHRLDQGPVVGFLRFLRALAAAKPEVCVFRAPDAAKPENGGLNLAPRPLETLLAGTGGCTAYDVVLILTRGRHDVRGCQVRLSAERAAQEPKVFTRIAMHFVVSGRGLPHAAVERAIALSHERYCSASVMLGKTAAISTSFEVVEV